MSNPYASPQNETDVDLSEAIAGDVRGMQIITGALAQGAVMLMVIALFVNKARLDGTPEILAWIGVGFAGLMFLLHLIVPQILLNSFLSQINKDEYGNATFAQRAQKVLATIRGPHIIACAMLEGAAFLNLIAYMFEHWIGNLIAAVTLIGLILIKFPTKTSMSFKVQDRMRELELT